MVSSPPRRAHRAPHAPPAPHAKHVVERTQTGVRMEKHLLKVLKALAEFHDLSLGDLLEGIVLHAFEGLPVFGPQGLARIQELKRIYGLKLDASHSHHLVERQEASAARAPRTPRAKAPRTPRAKAKP
jgi:hypothetical protein